MKDQEQKKFNKNRKNRRRQGNKKVEFDVSRKDINFGDLPHVVTDAKSNNDYKWYTHIYPAVKDIASFPFNRVSGLPFNLIRNTGNASNILYDSKGTPSVNTPPGIMALSVAPTVGIAKDEHAAVNVAAQQIYTLTRAANSGAKNYDKTDLMMVILGVDSAYTLYEELVRVYKTYRCINYLNRYTPNALLEAQRFGNAPTSPDNISGNLSAFRSIINLFAYKLASINIPDQFDFIHRHSWLFSNVYMDHNRDQAQYYLYRPAGFYKYVEADNNVEDPTPTHLEYIDHMTLFGLSGTQLVTTLEQVQQAINTIMDPLLGSADVGNISGDLAKAFGEGGMIKIAPLSEDATLVPVYDQEVLLQIMNSTVLNGGTPSNITVNYDNLVSGPFIQQSIKASVGATGTNISLSTMDRILNFIDMETSPENVMVATRFMYSAEGIGSTVFNNIELTSSGSAVILGGAIYYYAYVTLTEGEQWQLQTRPFTTDFLWEGRSEEMTPATVATNISRLCALSCFDWAPTVYNFMRLDPGESGATRLMQFIGFFQDLDDYTIISQRDIKALNDVAIMSEFAVKSFPTTMTK